MSSNRGLGVLLGALLLLVGSGCAQTSPAPGTAAGKTTTLDVVVAPKSGEPVAGLVAKDFTLMDNGRPMPLEGFHAFKGPGAPVEVLLLVDAVNTGFQSVSYERLQIERFLREHEGKLAQPTTLAVITDDGIKIEPQLTTDGNALSASLERSTIGLRDIRRSSGYYGAEDRLQISLKALGQLLAYEQTRPGRKVVLWVSPGWPLLSGPNTELSAKQEDALFRDAISFSDSMRRSRTTLYSIDPLGTGDAGTLRVFYYQEFLKPVTKPSQMQLGNLGLQVLAVQSGGLALNSSNDIATLLDRCMADTQAYYEMTYQEPAGEIPNEFHKIEVKVAQPGLEARTRQGYYAQH